MARQGITVLFIDDPRTGRRQAPNAGLYAAASAAGIQPAGIQVFDALRGLDYLLTRADVDPGKIGIAGLGAGTLQSYMAAALEPRFQFVEAVGGTTPYASLTQAAAAGGAPAVAGAGALVKVRVASAECLAPLSQLLTGEQRGKGRIKLEVDMDGTADVEIDLPGRFALTPATLRALREVPGIGRVEEV